MGSVHHLRGPGGLAGHQLGGAGVPAEPPVELAGEARECWDDVVARQRALAGVGAAWITSADVHLLVAACFGWARWREAARALEESIMRSRAMVRRSALDEGVGEEEAERRAEAASGTMIQGKSGMLEPSPFVAAELAQRRALEPLFKALGLAPAAERTRKDRPR